VGVAPLDAEPVPLSERREQLVLAVRTATQANARASEGNPVLATSSVSDNLPRDLSPLGSMGSR
jgi:hypothetical protein